jgi:hypothetical protein
MRWPFGWIRKLVTLGASGAVGRPVSANFSLMRKTVVAVSDCSCDPDMPCVCSDLDAMLEEVANTRVIQRGFKVGPDHFDVGPGTSLNDGEELISIYFHKDERDPELTKEPALTVGFTKEGAAKLMYTMMKAARAHGWIEERDSE